MSGEPVRWLSRAESDLDDAVFNIRDGRMSPGMFFLQQAVEKYRVLGSLKAGHYSFSVARKNFVSRIF